MTIQQFTDQCGAILGKSIESLGFHQGRALSRSRGFFLEYLRGDLCILLAYEDPELIVDLIIPIALDKWICISFNQLLWYQGKFDYKNATSLDQKLQILDENIVKLIDESSKIYSQDFDSRYCYEMNKKDKEIYFQAHF